VLNGRALLGHLRERDAASAGDVDRALDFLASAAR
jgi:hypothetical protein